MLKNPNWYQTVIIRGSSLFWKDFKKEKKKKKIGWEVLSFWKFCLPKEFKNFPRVCNISYRYPLNSFSIDLKCLIRTWTPSSQWVSEFQKNKICTPSIYVLLPTGFKWHMKNDLTSAISALCLSCIPFVR